MIYKRLPDYYNEKSIIENQKDTDNILKLNELEQSFNSKENNLFSVAFKVSTVTENNISKIKFYLLDENKTIICEKILDSQNFTHNSMVKIDFENQEVSKNKKYYILICPYLKNNEEEIKLACSDNDIYKDRDLKVDGENIYRDLVLNIYYKSNKLQIIKNSINNMEFQPNLNGLLIILLFFIGVLLIIFLNIL
ncbi:hypothetical protein [Clostridium caldaquaticum]|uniref:hypothetical protein n=1 Tax=Clostridium caldaquaticum TaxID=2940653 RepID=UPI0020771190|nr:hypothetical protein [Clostridium caldaquaticum]